MYDLLHPTLSYKSFLLWNISHERVTDKLSDEEQDSTEYDLEYNEDAIVSQIIAIITIDDAESNVNG